MVLPEEPLIDGRVPHPYREHLKYEREVLKELRAIRALLEIPRPGAGLAPRVSGIAPAPSPSAYIDVVTHGLRKFGALVFADDYIVETISLTTARSPAEEFETLKNSIAITVLKNEGTVDLYLNKKDDKHKITLPPLTYPQTFLIDWLIITNVYVGNTAQAGLNLVLIAWKPYTPPIPTLKPIPPFLALTTADYEEFHRMGDVNRDGIIDARDAEIIRTSMNARKGEPNYNPEADLNSDGIINIKDAARVGTNFGLTIEVWKAGKK